MKTERSRPSSKPAAPDAKPTAGGKPLPPATQTRMGAAFGHSFASVRVFADDAAAATSDAFGAEAFATGNDVFFGSGRYDPDTPAGQKLLAHELAHVVQQDHFGPGAKPVSEEADAAESEARSAADRVVSGGRAVITQASAAVSRHLKPKPNADELRVLTAQNVLKATDMLLGEPGVAAGDLVRRPPDSGAAVSDDPPSLRAGMDESRSIPLRDAPNPFEDLRTLREGMQSSGNIPRRGTPIPFGLGKMAIGSGNSADAALSGGVVKGFGRRDRYFEIAEDIKRMGAEVGLSESEVMAAVQMHATYGELPPGHPILSHPEATKLGPVTDLDALETFRARENLVLGTMGRELGATGYVGTAELYGAAPGSGQAHRGGLLPASLPGALKASRAVVPRIEAYTVGQMEGLGRTPDQYVVNDIGQAQPALSEPPGVEVPRGGRALAGRTNYYNAMVNMTDRWFGAQQGEGVPAPHSESAAEWMHGRLLPQIRSRDSGGPPGRRVWPGADFGRRGGGAGDAGAAPTGEAGATSLPASEAAPKPALTAPDPVVAAPTPDVPTPTAPHAGPAPAAPGTAPQGAAPAAEGVPSGAGAAGEVHLPLGRAAGMGAAGGGALAAINDLAVKRDFSLDSAGDIAIQSGAGAAGNVAQESLTARLGGGIANSAKAGGVVSAVTSGLFSTYNNGELYRQGKETAGQATANTLVDTGVGLSSGLAGAAAGAAIGSIIPGAGTLVGAGVGFLGGMAASYATNWMAEHSGLTAWAKKGLGRQFNHFNHGLSGVWNGVGHATEGLHNAWGGAKGGLRHAGHALADGASHALHGAEHFGLNALHGAEHLGSDVLHGGAHLLHSAERYGANALHGAEHFGMNALHGAEHLGAGLLHGGEHLAARALHGGEQLASNALQGGARLLHNVEHAGVNALHGAEHLGANVLHGAEHLGAGALHGAEDVAHGVGNAAAGAWHKLTGWL